MRRVLDHVERLLVVAVVLLLAAFTVVVTYQVLSRYVGFVPRFIWTQEISRFCFIWMVFLGAAIGVRRQTHFQIDVFPSTMPRWAQRLVVAFVALVTAAVVAAALLGGYEFFQIGFRRTSTTSGIRLAWVYLAIPVSFVFMAVFTVEKLIDGLFGAPPEAKGDEASGRVA